ncbi:MICOS complex subunit MIC60 [Sphingomonas immobilis]|uniref:Inner membrane protein n=1 Tax=Sphingomonas immobilis TaxID=3063997 RepID=A0ABT8ZVE7_9SPHN|nr:hypothetical protein [Sphingomonas sp. CA1-15]MDO7841544.1 hypothetical protein [Sphingomonas sp. CA1-15]
MDQDPPIELSTGVPIEVAARRKPRWPIFAVLALVLILIGAAAAYFAIRHFDLAPAPKVATLTLPVTPGASGPQAPVVIVPSKGTSQSATIDLDALSNRETALAAQLNALEGRTAGVSADAQAAAGNATRAEGMLIAFAARRALDRGTSLGFIEGRLRDRFGGAQGQAVATIVQAARQPVTLEDLRGGLEAVAPSLVTGGLSGGFFTSLQRELSSLVVLHNADAPSPLPGERLARARRLLEIGQVEAALAEVAHLPGAAGATRWTDAAKRYIETRRALDIIETAALLGQAAGSVATPAPPPAPAPSPTPRP